MKKRKSDEPSWLYDDPNKKPVEYSDKDLDEFADGFIRSNRDIPVVKEMIRNCGLKKAKEIIKTAIKSKKKIEEIVEKMN